MKKFSKQDLIDAVYEKTDMNRTESRNAVELIIEEIKDALLRRQAVDLRGLGSFDIKVRKARMARNPMTGETITVRAHGAVTFKPGSELKQAARSINDDKKKKKAGK